MVGILVAYVAFILVLMVVRGAYMSPDLFVVLALVMVVVMGRTRLFLRDWLPFVAIFLGWESMRGLADELGATVHSTDVIALERFFFAGRIPSEVLQAAFHTRARSTPSTWPLHSCTSPTSPCRWWWRSSSGSSSGGCSIGTCWRSCSCRSRPSSATS